MTPQDYNKALATVIKMIVANNAGGVARALMNMGYPTRNKIPSSELESAMFTLYSASPEKFYEVLKSIPWLYNNNNWTNNAEYRSEIMELLGGTTRSEVSRGNWWDVVLELIKPPVDQYAPPQNENTRGVIFWSGMLLITIGVVVVLIVTIKNI